MELQLDSKFRVTKDKSEMNFQLERLENIKDRETGEMKQEWKVAGFHGKSFRSVLSQYQKEALFNENELGSINSVLEKLEEVNRTIQRVVKQINIKLSGNQDD